MRKIKKSSDDGEELYTFADYKETKPKAKKAKPPIKKAKATQDRYAYGRAYRLLKEYGCFYAKRQWCDNSGLPLHDNVIDAADVLRKRKSL